MASGTALRSLALRDGARRSSSGITRSLQTMVETAIASTITMPVAADSPPDEGGERERRRPLASGSESTKVSGSAGAGRSAAAAERDRAARTG